MHKYCLHLMYDGTHYSGWQMQPNAPSIQQIIQETITALIRQEVSVVGSGRTDAGVHALNQVAHFTSLIPIEPERFFRSINGMLPYEIRVTKVFEVPLAFHAQKSAKSKEYTYRICLEPIVAPFERLYCLHVPFTIDIDLLKEAARQFLGTHDFSSFANSRHEGAAAKNPVRTLYRLDVAPWEYGICLEFEGDGFLYKMVRNIVGMLLQVASKKRPIEDIKAIFAAKDRRVAPMAAGARGLFLTKVNYEKLFQTL